MLRPSARPGKPPRSLGTHVVASLILGEVQHAFPRSLREQQIRLTTPTCRTPPGQSSAIRRAPPKALLIRPGFDVTYPVTTRQLRSQTSGLRNRLPDPHLTQSSAPFPVSLTTTVFSQRSTRWFGTSQRRAVPKGLPSSLAQHRIKKPRLHDQAPLYVRGTPRVLDTRGPDHLDQVPQQPEPGDVRGGRGECRLGCVAVEFDHAGDSLPERLT